MDAVRSEALRRINLNLLGLKAAAIQRRDPSAVALVQAVMDLRDIVEWVTQRANPTPVPTPTSDGGP